MRIFINYPNRLYIMVICVWIIVLAGVFYLVAKPVREPSLDFFVYYYGASAIHQGKPLYALESQEYIAKSAGITLASQYTYLPTLAILMQPFVLLSPYVASLLWFMINVGLIVIGVRLLIKQINFRHNRVKVAMLLLPVLFTPVLMNLFLGNINFLILVLIILAYQQFVSKRPYVSGVMLALSAWIKVWPIGLIAYFVWKREWKVVIGAVIGLISIGVLIVMLAGVGQTTSFFTGRLSELLLGTEPGHDHLNQSILGVFAKMFSPSSPYVLPLIQSPILAEQGGRIAALLVMVTTAIICSWPITLKNREQFSNEFILVIITILMITGWLWEASLTLLLPAYFIIAEKVKRESITSWRKIVLPVVSIILIDLHRVIWTLANPDRHALPWFLLIFPFLGLMLMWLFFVVRRIREIKTGRAVYLHQPKKLETI